MAKAVDDLGQFSAAELRAGGFHRRGFLRPLLPVPPGVDEAAESRRATESLAARGQLEVVGTNWRPVGHYCRVLDAAAAARSLVALESVGATAPRLVFARLGATDRVLDLCPQQQSFACRMLRRDAAAGDLVASLGLTEGHDADRVVSESDTGWSEIESLLRGGTVSAKVEAATVLAPDEPLLQHRVFLVDAGGERWLQVGRRRGPEAVRYAASAAPGRCRSIMLALLEGVPAAPGVARERRAGS